MTKNELKEMVLMILQHRELELKNVLYVSNDMEVISYVFECFCGSYWTGKSARIGAKISGKEMKSKVCRNCTERIYEAQKIAGNKIKLQSKPKWYKDTSALKGIEHDEDVIENVSMNMYKFVSYGAKPNFHRQEKILFEENMTYDEACKIAKLAIEHHDKVVQELTIGKYDKSLIDACSLLLFNPASNVNILTILEMNSIVSKDQIVLLKVVQRILDILGVIEVNDD